MKPLKAVKLLLNEGKIDKDIVLLTDGMYLQKQVQFQQGKLIGCDDNDNLFKEIMTFMIVDYGRMCLLWSKLCQNRK